MATNLPAKQNGNTQEFFDIYNNSNRRDTSVSTNEYEAVMGFFLRKTNDNKTVSLSLVDAIMQIANIHNINPMGLIDELNFDNLSLTDVQTIIISLINQTRNNTSILGFNKDRNSSPDVVRNIMV